MENYLILIRHGQSLWNLENKFTGWVDIELSPQGFIEAGMAGEQLKPYKCDVLWTSDLTRAQQTLSEIVKKTGWNVPVIKTQGLNERNYGDLQGLNKAETILKHGDAQVHLWRRSFDVKPPNGESLKDTLERVRPVWENCLAPALAAGKNIVVVAHGNSNRALFKIVENISDEAIPQLELETGKPYFFKVIGVDGMTPKLVRVEK